MTVNDTQDLIDFYIELNQQGILSDVATGVLISDLIF